jgi:mono/diheme cytochrome c family protein
MGKWRWRWIIVGCGVVLVGLAVGLLAFPEGPPVNSSHPGAALYRTHCVTCHGVTGRGDSWRARLLFLRPGDLTDPTAMGTFSDEALFQIIKHGGSSFGKPGMPSFGFHLSDDEIRSLVAYLRGLATRPAAAPGREDGQKGAERPKVPRA